MSAERIQRAIALGISADTQEARKQISAMLSLLKSVKDPTDDLRKVTRLLKEEVKAKTTTDEQARIAIEKATLAAEKQKAAIASLREEYAKLDRTQKEAAKAQAAANRMGPGRPEFREQQARNRAAQAANLRAQQEANGRVLEGLEAQRAAGEAARAAREARLRDLRRSAAANNAVGPGRADLEYGRSRAEALAAMPVGPGREEYRAQVERNNHLMAMNRQGRQEARARVLAELEAQRAAGEAARAAREARRAAMQQSARSGRGTFGPGQADLEWGRQRAAAASEANAWAMGPDRQDFDFQRAGSRRVRREQRAMEAESARLIRDQNDAMQEGWRYMQQYETAHERLNRRREEAHTLLRRGAITNEEYARALRSISRDASLAHRAISGVRTAVSTFLGPLVIAVAAFEGLRRSIQLSAELEKSRAKFEVFTGSAEEANRILKELRSLSQTSPISFSGAQKATTTMLQFGVAAKDVISSVRAVGEITGGDADRMQNLALAYSQSAAAGRLMGQELLQMVNAGFNPLKIISQETGKSLTVLREEMSKGLITFDMVDAAFKKQAREQGTLDKISKTSAGSIQLMKSRLEELGTAIGEALPTGNIAFGIAQSLQDITIVVKTTSEAFRQLGRDIQMALGGKGDMKMPHVSGFSMLAQGIDIVKLSQMINGQDKQGIVDTYDRIQERSGGLFGKVYGFKDRVEQYRKELAKLREDADKAAKATRTLEQAQVDVDKAFGESIQKLKDEVLEGRYGKDKHAALSALAGSLWGADRAMAQNALEKGTDADSVFATITANAKDKEALKLALKAYHEMVALQDQLAQKKKLTAEQTEREKKANEALKELMKEGDRIRESQMPDGDFVMAMARASAAYAEGLMSSTDLTREKERLLNEASQNKKVENNRIAPSLRVGSQEAFTAMIKAADAAQGRRDAVQERIELQTRTQNDISRETNRLLIEVKDANLGDGG